MALLKWAESIWRMWAALDLTCRALNCENKAAAKSNAIKHTWKSEWARFYESDVNTEFLSSFSPVQTEDTALFNLVTCNCFIFLICKLNLFISSTWHFCSTRFQNENERFFQQLLKRATQDSAALHNTRAPETRISHAHVYLSIVVRTRDALEVQNVLTIMVLNQNLPTQL